MRHLQEVNDKSCRRCWSLRCLGMSVITWIVTPRKELVELVGREPYTGDLRKRVLEFKRVMSQPMMEKGL